MMLMSTIDTMGIKILYLSVSMHISPGNLPNHFNSHGAKCSIIPTTISIIPIIIIQRAINFTRKYDYKLIDLV
jgi:hypothetical protein